MGIKHAFTSGKSDQTDTTKVRPTQWNSDHAIDGDVDFDGHSITNADEVNADAVIATDVTATGVVANTVTVSDDPYNQTAWDGSSAVPTKNAVRDKIEALILSGGGVTDFLSLDDTPDAYAGFGGNSIGAVVGVNSAMSALEFRYSTNDYVDIRDYGSVVHNTNITAPLQAAIDDYSTHLNRTIRVPFVVTSTLFPGSRPKYILDAITWPSDGWVLELDCVELALNATLVCPGNFTIRGMGTKRGSQSFGHGPGQQPSIFSNVALSETILVGTNNNLIENVGVVGAGGHGINIQHTANTIIRNCYTDTTSSSHTGLKIESSFWTILEDLVCSGKSDGSNYAIEFTTDINFGPNQSLVTARNIKPFNSGILFRANYGPEGVGSTYIEDLCSENQVDGTDLITFDSTNGSVNTIRIINPVIADATGVVRTINNIGTGTNGITIEGAYQSPSFRAGSTAISNLYIDQVMPPTLGTMRSIQAVQVGSDHLTSWSLRTPTAIDAKLLCAPVGLPWVFGTPLPVIQNPASWVSHSGGVITPGQLAPDGSTMAGRVAGGGGARCYDIAHVYTVGDWFIMGVWVRHANLGITNNDSGPSFITADATLRVNGVVFPGWLTEGFLEYNVPDDGWHWTCQAYQITASDGVTPGTLRFYLNNSGGTYDFFNPSIVRIPASAGIDDAWAIRLARSLRGGWSPGGTAGNISLPDHQLIQLGASGGSVTGGVQANKMITPKAATLTIAAGVITVTGSYHRVDTEAAAATDDLDTISGGVDGYKLILRANNTARTVVAKDGTGNLKLAGDFSLDNTEDTIELIYDATLTAWLELGRSDNGA